MKQEKKMKKELPYGSRLPRRWTKPFPLSANGCLIAVLDMSIVVSITLLPHQFGALVLVKEIVKKMMTEDQAIPISKPADKE